MASDLDRWRQDPCAFIREVLINPETGAPFELYAAEERFFREALTLDHDGRVPYPELIYSCPKKSGKTGFVAMTVLYVVIVLGGPYAEGYSVANDFEQAQGRVFAAICRIVKASPKLRGGAKRTANRIEFPASGASITAIASDYAGAAGSNPTISAFDELWAYTSESAQRLWDEMIPVPTRKVSIRLTTTYAGFSNESTLLENLYKRGLEGKEISPALYRQDGLLMFWSHEPVAPWQDERWLAQMRTQSSRESAFRRLIRNEWISSESRFIDPEMFDACVDAEARPVSSDRNLEVYAGLDASLRHDTTALVAITYDAKTQTVRPVAHKLFRAQGEDIEFSMIENAVVGDELKISPRSVRSAIGQVLAEIFECVAFPRELGFGNCVPSASDSIAPPGGIRRKNLYSARRSAKFSAKTAIWTV